MRERGTVRLNIQRGAGTAEFGKFLADLESAYLALYFLPTENSTPRFRSELYFLVHHLVVDPSIPSYGSLLDIGGREIYPNDQLEITRISIQSPGWIELLGSLNPLQQIREYLKDRHERMKDKSWRGEAEKKRAILENDLLQQQVETARIGTITAYSDLLKSAGFGSDEIRQAVWQRVGAPMMRLAHHQDTGLLGSQNDDVDGKRD